MKSAEILKNIYDSKSKQRPGYSLRLFAKDLDISSAYLSMILSGKRKLNMSKAKQICSQVTLSEKLEQRFLAAVAMENLSPEAKKILTDSVKNLWSSDFKEVHVDYVEILSSWYHLAILDLATCRGFQFSTDYIVNKLGISREQCISALRCLVKSGLLIESNGEWTKSTPKMKISKEQSRDLIRKFLKQMLVKANDQLDSSQGFEDRKITGVTIAVNTEKLAEAKALVDKFKKDMAGLLTDGECSEVYQLNIQLFPLTKKGVH